MKKLLKYLALGALCVSILGSTPAFAEGNNTRNSWVTSQGNKYRTDGSGNYLTGWQQIDGNYYYFDKEGIAQSGWIDVEGIWYYLNADGIMHTGWLRDDDAWYYFSEAGVMQVGWVYTDDNWYYLKENGRMSIMNQQFGDSVYRFAPTGELSTVTIDSEVEYGSFDAFVLADEEQAFMDALNEERGKSDKKALILDLTLNQVAKKRLNGALTSGYYTKNKTVTGQGTLKDSLKEINYYPNRGTLELYLRGVDIETAVNTFKRSSDYSKLFNYNRAGISVQEKNDRYYIIVVLMK